MLHTQVPLVDLRVAPFAGIQIVVVGKAPKCEFPIFVALRRSVAVWKWIVERRKWRLEIVFREQDGMRIAEGCASKLKIRGDVQAIIDSGSTADHGIGVDGVGKTESWCNVVAVHRYVAIPGGWEFGDAVQIDGLINQAGNVDGHGDAAIACEVAVLNQIVPLGVGSAPLVAQSDIYRQFRIDLPVVLYIESRFQ